jgi:hypothetical protein
MVGEKRRISQVFKSLFGRKPKSVAEEIEEQIDKEIDEILGRCNETISFSYEDNVGFCDDVEDFNRIHRDKEAAKAFKFIKFEDTPIVGVLSASTGARIVGNALNQLREYWGAQEEELKVLGQEISFKNPCYPGEEISLSFGGYKESTTGIELSLLGSVKKKEVIEITTRLGTAFNLMPQIAGPITSYVYGLDESKITSMLEHTKGAYNGSILPILPAAFMPSPLINLLEQRTGSTEGANLRMNLDYLAQAVHPGQIQVDIFTPSRIPQPGGRPLYKFRSVVSQDTVPLVYGMITSATPEIVDLSITPTNQRTS